LTHIGVRPSVDHSSDVTIETHLFDFSRDIYSKIIETELHLYIRGTKKFNNLDEVKAQVDMDALTAKTYFRDMWRAGGFNIHKSQ
jgi:riboflavin kinase/FMN adenylyltransferase